MQGIAVGQESSNPAFAQRLIEGVRVLVYGLRPLTEPEFDAHIAGAVAMAQSVRGVMVVRESDLGLGPSRRAKLAKRGLLHVPTAVLSDSIRVRGQLTPINWVGGDMHPFAMNEFDKACDFLGVAPEVRPHFLEQLTAMLTEVGISRPVHKAGSNRSIGAALSALKRAVIDRVRIIRKKSTPDSEP